MDWSKAKNILILIFIALNIFLFLNMNILNLQGGVAAETIKSTVDV